jgi:hypothetical protein
MAIHRYSTQTKNKDTSSIYKYIFNLDKLENGNKEYIYSYMLFITLGDGLIDPSPRPANPLTDRVTHAN